MENVARAFHVASGRQAMRRPHKPRREFRAFLIAALQRDGVKLPDNPPYSLLAQEIERVWLRRPLRRRA